MDFDDLHEPVAGDGVDPDVVVPVLDDDGNEIIEPIPVDPDEDPANPEIVPPVGTDPPDPGNPADADPDGNPDIKLTGIEQYLSQFDIEAGMIAFDDGESKHFNDLDPEKQAEVLSELHKTSVKSVEEKFGLDNDEIGLINYLRENNKSIDDVVGELATKRVEAIMLAQQSEGKDYDTMDPDAIYTAFLKKSNPETTAEDLEKDLAAAKGMTNYTNVVNSLKAGFKRDQELEAGEAKRTQAATSAVELEDQRKLIVNTVTGLADIDGMTVDSSMKNSVLDTILSVDEDGDSKFMTDVFSDPTKLFKAAFWYNNGADILKSKETFWKKEKSEAFKRGQESNKDGKISFSSGKDKTTPDLGNFDEVGVNDWDSLH